MNREHNKKLIIIPACGPGTRMGGVPKFLLPLTPNKSLLSNILDIVTIPENEVWISTRPEYATMLFEYTRTYAPSIRATLTSTMSETVAHYKDFNYPTTVMLMPDTYINDTAILSKIDEALKDADIAVCVWKIQDYQKGKLGQCKIDQHGMITEIMDKDKDCPYEYAWGAIGWKPPFWDHIDTKTSHIGYALNPAIDAGLKVRAVYMDGTYNDCGTIAEYTMLLKQLQ